jgi:hypothetical protein
MIYANSLAPAGKGQIHAAISTLGERDGDAGVGTPSACLLPFGLGDAACSAFRTASRNVSNSTICPARAELISAA